MPWDWCGISCNPNITPKFILKNLDKDWFWYDLSYNPNITPEFISENKNKPWCWLSLSARSFKQSITKEQILERIG